MFVMGMLFGSVAAHLTFAFLGVLVEWTELRMQKRARKGESWLDKSSIYYTPEKE